MTKNYRQAQILKLIRTRSIHTQEELSKALGKVGITVTQVTLSRDLREVGLVKGAEGYQEPSESAAPGDHGAGTLKRAVEEFVREVKTAQNLLILKTAPGDSSPLASALDREGWPEILGTIAGDDTVFAATPSGSRARQARDKILALLRDHGATPR